jgi:hypothetical protein
MDSDGVVEKGQAQHSEPLKETAHEAAERGELWLLDIHV